LFGNFHLSLEPLSATSVALCIAHAALPKQRWLAQRKIDDEWPVQGLFARLHLDNAKEFHSEAPRRGCEQYGIAIDYRPVRTPRVKLLRQHFARCPSLRIGVRRSTLNLLL